MYALCVVVLAGMATGLLYDMARVARSYMRRHRWGQFIVDLVFWGSAALTLGAGLLLANWGDLRGYILLGALTGAALYLYLASPVVLNLLRLLGRLIFAALWLLTWPLRTVVGVFTRLAARAWRRLRPPPVPPAG